MADATANERELVVLARALIAGQAAEVQALLLDAQPVPPMISPTCARLVGDALAKAWPALWRRGGVSPGASLDAGTVRRGRVWERHAPVGLAFSVATLRLLRWLLGTRLGAPSSGISPLQGESLTVGDQVMVYLALDAARPALRSVIAAQPLVRAAPLAWLGFAELFAAAAQEPPAFDGLCQGAGAIVVESLAAELARRWAAVELSKRAIASPGALIALGAIQDATLQGFLAACDRHRRRDLAGFVLDAAAPLLERGPAPAPRLDPTTTLASRAAARVASGALLRAVLVWAAWDQEHRGVRFIDDDYAAAQLLLARFEAIQSTGAARAAAWLADLSSLPATTAPASADTIEAP
jgi:hypothetical protein